MLTKYGKTIPFELAVAINKSLSTRKAWNLLRPSCQFDYVELIKKAKTDAARTKAVSRVMKLTMEYAKKHPEKF